MMRHSKIAAASLALAAALAGCSTLNHQTHHDCTVISKEIIYKMVDGNSKRTKRLDTTCGTFDVDDSVGGGWSSWERWRFLVVGHTYDIRTGGYRIPGHFPTVIGLTETTKS